MKSTIILFSFIISGLALSAQGTPVNDSVVGGIVTVNKDPRLDILGKKVAEFNEAAASALRSGKGYRLMVLNSNDRDYAMKVRTQLLQRFPEQKVYMTYQAPYFKLKFGNFPEKEDGEKYRKMLISGKIVTNNVYLIPDTIEMKGDKNKEKDDN